MYDVISGKDTFGKTTREMAEYVGHEFDDAGKFHMVPTWWTSSSDQPKPGSRIQAVEDGMP